MTAASYSIRAAGPGDLSPIMELCADLWPDEPAEEVRPHMAALLAGKPHSTLPLIVFVATFTDVVVGFIEIGLRSHAEGCDGRRAVGFIEGWYVRPEHRCQGVGRALVARAEQWSVEQGALEIASDTWIDHELSIDVHRALGFELVERVTCFRKACRPGRMNGNLAPRGPERPINRGDLFWLEPDETRGSIPGIPHPHVVVQEDVFNHSRIGTVVLCALSSNLQKAAEPGNVLLDPGEGGLAKQSVVIASQVSSVEKLHLGAYIGSLSRARVDQVVAGLQFVQASFHRHGHGAS